MSVEKLDFAEPFFTVRHLVDEPEFGITRPSIVLNLSSAGLQFEQQTLGLFRSVVVTNTLIHDVERCLVVEDYDRNTDQQALFERIKTEWVLAFDATGEERHRGVGLWRSPKTRLGNVETNMCYADTIPLNVGLHQLHWGGTTFKEVHTQIVGFGRMQQYREKDLTTLYAEELLAPGATHQPMYDDEGNYPWHQYETITRGVFMPIEMQL
jgi:hypothetical protein